MQKDHIRVSIEKCHVRSEYADFATNRRSRLFGAKRSNSFLNYMVAKFVWFDNVTYMSQYNGVVSTVC